jgi:hypothetical protein
MVHASNAGGWHMARNELELQLERFEELLDEIMALLDDPDISDDELREEIRAVLEETNADE